MDKVYLRKYCKNHPFQSPIPKVDDEAFIISDAEESGTDDNLLSDASDSEEENQEKYASWASVNVGQEETKVRSEKFVTIQEEETKISSSHTTVEVAKISTETIYTTEYALKLVNEQVESGEFEEVTVNMGEGIGCYRFFII